MNAMYRMDAISFAIVISVASLFAQEPDNGLHVLERIDINLREIKRDQNDYFNKYVQLLHENHLEREKHKKELDSMRLSIVKLSEAVQDLKTESRDHKKAIREQSTAVSELKQIRKEKYEQTEIILKNIESYNRKKLTEIIYRSHNYSKISEKILNLLNSGQLNINGNQECDSETLSKTMSETLDINLRNFKNIQLQPEFETMTEIKNEVEKLKDSFFQIRPNCNDHSEEMKIIIENSFKNLTHMFETKVIEQLKNTRKLEPPAIEHDEQVKPDVNPKPSNNADEDLEIKPFHQGHIHVQPPPVMEREPCHSFAFVHEPQNCAELRKDGVTCDGEYLIHVHSSVDDRFAYCDMTTDGGGWTVIARRGDMGDKQTSFNKSWKSYKMGFGTLTKEFWFGNNNLYRITSQEVNALRVTLESFEGEVLRLTYDEFYVGNATTNYELKIGNIIEDGEHPAFGESLKVHNQQPFSTLDENNSGNNLECAKKYKGGWWYKSDECFQAILTAPYFKEGEYREDEEGIIWKSWKGWQILKSVEMKIRPVNFNVDMQ